MREIISQSQVDLGFAIVSQDNSGARLVFGKSSCYTFGRYTPQYVAAFFPFWLSKEGPLQQASSQMVQPNLYISVQQTEQTKVKYFWVQAPPMNWTSQGEQNENRFFNRYDVSETDGDHFRFSFYCLILSFILHHITRSVTSQLVAITFQQLAETSGAHTSGQGIPQHFCTLHIPPAFRITVTIHS